MPCSRVAQLRKQTKQAAKRKAQRAARGCKPTEAKKVEDRFTRHASQLLRDKMRIEKEKKIYKADSEKWWSWWESLPRQTKLRLKKEAKARRRGRRSRNV